MSSGTEEFLDLRCRSCNRRLGIAPRESRVYCDSWCAEDFTTTSAEDRDALIEAIFQTQSPPKAVLARRFGISRQRVDQILTMRDLRIQPESDDD